MQGVAISYQPTPTLYVTCGSGQTWSSVNF